MCSDVQRSPAVEVPERARPDAALDRCDVRVVRHEHVARARAGMASPEVAQRMSAIFKTLADPGRCRLLAALIAAGELCVCELAASVGMSESNVSHHLRVLRDQGLVRGRRAGKLVFYAPDDEHVRVLLDIARDHVRHSAAPA